VNEHWSNWQPSKEDPWDLRRVIHLHRRAAFAPTWNEIQRDLKDGPTVAIDRLLSGRARMQGVPVDFAEMSEVIGGAAVSSGSAHRLKAWWMYRLLFSPDPLGEKLTLLWHNHFATSNLKVDDLSAMRRQNETLRQHARGKFRNLLNAMLRDPALLNWLDASSNKQGQPNENLARELMELFTLGLGNYTEDDVKQAARALTGWTVKDGHQAFDEKEHDVGKKTILGKSGTWQVDDLSAMLLEHPATSRRLAWRICNVFMGEGVLSDEAIETLATGLREHDLNMGWAVETVLRSELFFTEANIGTRVASPVEFIINSVRSLEAFDPPPSTLLLAEWSARMGQDLFYPPNVGGWTGGRDWLGSRYVVARANFARALVEGRLRASATPLTLWNLAHERTGANELKGCVEYFGELMHRDVASQEEVVMRARQREEIEEQLQLAVGVLLAQPEAWLL
jgi:uncharacterized protein (DUF1800 family)